MKPLRRSGIIRQRGQLTIPESIRKAVKWAKSFCAVSIVLESPEMIVIRPHREGGGEADWDWIYTEMERVRRLTATGKGGSASAFIARDREQRR